MIDSIKFWKGSTNIGSAIALFDAAERDWALVYFQPEQPILEGELNLLQQAQNRRMRELLRGIYPDGGILKDLSPVATGVADQFRLHTQDKPFSVTLDGLTKAVYAYDQGASPTAGGNRIVMPAYTSGTYDELVYLEVWFEEVKSPEGAAGTLGDADTNVYRYGMVSSLPTLDNDVKVSVVPLAETTRRVQLRGEIKTQLGADLAGTLAKGVSGYGFTKPQASNNFYRAGDGTQESGQALNAVDGYVYAIPLVLVNRKASTIAQGDISVASPIIPTGSDVVASILSLEDRVDALELPTYWTASNRRSDLDDDARFLRIANNLSDLASAATARTNLGLGAAATMGTTALRTNTSTTTVLQAKAMADHVTSDDHDGRYYTEAEVDALIAGIDLTGHTHDDRYYTETEVNALLTGKSDVGHLHDDRYYTEAEIDVMLAGTMTEGHTHEAADIISGTFPVARGGTGLSTLTSGNFIRAATTSTFEQRTPAQVRADIGAVGGNASIVAGTHTKITYDTKGLITGGANLSAGDIPDLSGTYLVKNTAITGATKTKITYDADGLVTAGADLAAGDIPSLDAAKITTGTFALARIPTGTTSSTVALGSHTHSEYMEGNAAIVAGTATKITYDAKGLVTGGASLASGDIPSLDASKITTGTFSDARLPTVPIDKGGTGATTASAARTALGAGTVTSVSAGTGLDFTTITGSGSVTLRDIAAGSSSGGALKYNGTSRSAGKLYGGTTNPLSTTRLNYDGYLYATQLYDGGTRVSKEGHSHSTLTPGTGISGSAYNGTAAQTFSLTAISAGSASGGALYYNGTSRSAGRLYGGTTAPSSTTRVNYDGYLYATRLYSGGTEVSKVGHTHSGAELTDGSVTAAKTSFMNSNGSSAGIYAGRVSSTGSAVRLPSGWTCSGGSGSYRVTHNLGTTGYAVSITMENENNAGWTFIPASGLTANYFDYVTYGKSGTLMSIQANFVMVRY